MRRPKPPRPQNPSCSAGGTTDIERTQRGVVVAPPSRNTDHSEPYTILHRGFDTINLSIKASLPEDLLRVLDEHKDRASTDGADALVTFNGLTFHLKGHGGHGYAFILSGGPDGANWSFKRPNPKDPWGVKVNVGSRFLATQGLGRAKAHIEDWMAAFGMRFGPSDVSFARVDFCVDILAPDFNLIPDQFVMHSSTGRRDYIAPDPMTVHVRSGRVTSVTVGSTRNRQVIIYDKRAEVIARNKAYWWSIWNHTVQRGPASYLSRDGHAPLSRKLALCPDPEQAAGNRVWRVEIRAGKDLMKDRWDIRTWEDLFNRYGDLFREAGEVVRYTDPASGDTNRARWPNHPLWEVAVAEANDDLTDMRSGADPNPMKQVQREDHIGLLIRNMTGTAISVAALQGVRGVDGLPAALDRIITVMQDRIAADSDHTAKILTRAQDRYVFLQDR